MNSGFCNFFTQIPIRLKMTPKYQSNSARAEISPPNLICHHKSFTFKLYLIIKSCIISKDLLAKKFMNFDQFYDNCPNFNVWQINTQTFWLCNFVLVIIFRRECSNVTTEFNYVAQIVGDLNDVISPPLHSAKLLSLSLFFFLLGKNASAARLHMHIFNHVEMGHIYICNKYHNSYVIIR